MNKTLHLIASFALLTSLLVACTNSNHFVQIGDCDRNTHISSNGFKSSKISYQGHLEPSEDDRSIVGVSRDGYLEISRGIPGFQKRVVIKADEDGKLVRKFYKGWSQKDFHPEGEEWLAEILPGILRSTRIGLEYRLERFYEEGGVDAVLQEVALLKGDVVRKAYLEALLEKDLSHPELARALKAAGEEISSDHYLSEFLKRQSQSFFQDDKRMAFVQAAQHISSDHYLNDLLSELVKSEVLEPVHSSVLLTMAGDISSGHYLSDILVKVLQSRKTDTEGMLQLFRLTEDISSDHYSAQALKAVAPDYQLSPRIMQEYCTAMAGINSDHYMADVVFAMLKEGQSDENISLLLQTSAYNISSDHYLAQVLDKALETSELGQASFSTFLEAAKHIDSRHYQNEVLNSLVIEHEFSERQLKELNDSFPAHNLVSSL